VLVVPLVAFDRRGFRLGYGKGFYDKALARLPGARTVGIAYAAQEIARVPHEAHDHPLDVIVTEKETLRPLRT
jgi:5-formyltetrahydrofolate cyclo-ligase